uniref:Uncharacterized protein n=1 Tax=Globodera rostochiensis TaxID=31243 RepID=A0A914HMX0_GLORO
MMGVPTFRRLTFRRRDTSSTKQKYDISSTKPKTTLRRRDISSMSLALLDWCHKNHRQISMTELAYIVEKLRELLFPDVPIVEWEQEREQTRRNRLDFAEFGHSFGTKPRIEEVLGEHAKRDDNSFANLIVGILENEALADGADKRVSD